jgi:tight adherence protein B
MTSPELVASGPMLALALAIGVSVGSLALAAVASGSGPRRGFARRIERLRERGAGDAPEAVASLRRSHGQLSALERGIGRFVPRPGRLAERLARAGFEPRLTAYALASLAVAIAAAVAAVMLGLGPAAAALGGIGAGLGLPHLTVGWLARRRSQKFTALLPEAIELIVRGVKSGLPVSELIGTVASEIPDPMRREFRRVDDAIKLGQSLEEAFASAARRIDAPEFGFFVIALSVQRETGGNLAETLENLIDILRKRRQMKLKVKAMSSEARASAYILGSLPFIMLAILLVLNSGYIMALFTDPRGQMMLAFGGLTILVGVLVMAKMVRFEI